MKKKRFAIAGMSIRALYMFAKPLTTKFNETAELVAMWDISQVHMDYANSQLPKPVPTYTDFDRMLKEADFDTLIVVTMDRYHHEYVIRALEAGKDVITEKPMTIDDKKCRAILAAEKKTGRKVTVTFNYRFTPPMTAIRRIVGDGTLGDIVTVDMHWPLDQSHGADYFRRWHARRENTGGLQVHKSTHHFDLINWILQDEPRDVCAQGSLAFYGRNNSYRGKRCMGCKYKDKCHFYWDILSDEWGRNYYVASEPETGYFRDGCVWDGRIDIEDNYSLMVNYKRGARLSYSLQAFAPWEGFRLEIQGTKGRVDYLELHGKHDWADPGDRQIIIMLNDGSRSLYTPPKGVGGHGGGDSVLQRKLFDKIGDDPLGHMAGTRAACNSVLIGVAATKSLQNKGKWIRVPDLLKG